MRHRKIRILSTTLIVLAVCFAIFFTVRLLASVINFSFIDLDLWANISFIEDASKITTANRIAYFLIWMSVLFASLYAIYRGVRVLLNYRNANYFSPKSFGDVFRFGVAIIIATIADTFLASLSRPILTWSNTDYRAPIRYYVDNGDISLALCGLGFCLIGWVLGVAYDLEIENKAII